jgi:hypothetical protein
MTNKALARTREGNKEKEMVNNTSRGKVCKRCDKLQVRCCKLQSILADIQFTLHRINTNRNAVCKRCSKRGPIYRELIIRGDDGIMLTQVFFCRECWNDIYRSVGKATFLVDYWHREG